MVLVIAMQMKKIIFHEMKGSIRPYISFIYHSNNMSNIFINNQEVLFMKKRN
jgi:hypothetical protein